MDLLIGWRPYVTEFRGERVMVDLRPLTVELYKIVLPYMRRYDTKEETADKALELVGKALPLFRDHVSNIRGVTINGAAITPEQLYSEAVLVQFAQDLIQELFLRSTITEEESKNLDLPSDALSSDQNSTTQSPA